MTKTYFAQFPSSQAGKLPTTTYRLYDASGTAVGAATGVGIYETGSGGYAVQITHADSFEGTIRWNTGGADPRTATDPINPASGTPKNVSVEIKEVRAQ